MAELERLSGPTLPTNIHEGNICLPNGCDTGDHLAIAVQGAYKSYGSRSRKVQVLQNLDMTIPKGNIYGLLGPSGCGKTTLLQCLVGKLVVDSGTIMVFGCTPRSRESLVPGPSVGYMPQELALYGEFTIKETLQYFGRIFKMKPERVAERTEFLLQFLDLPRTWRQIMNLSGGQRRRASLAAALLHEPQLLVLDEPTVGVDPLLRQTIWTHLSAISQSSTTTIVITTHYVEEAKQAHRVGMMRGGRLLAEDSPSVLMDRLNLVSLEDVFLHLCRQEGDMDTHTAIQYQPHQMEKKKLEASRECEDKSFNAMVFFLCIWDLVSWLRVSALLVKNFIRMWRNLGFLVFQFIIPAIQVSLFCLAIGREPKGMVMVVVNEEVGGAACANFSTGCLMAVDHDFVNSNWDVGDDNDVDNDPEIGGKNFSCRYLSHLDPSVLGLVYMDSLEDAFNSVKEAKYWGILHFREDYTEAMEDRLSSLSRGANVSREVINSSAAHVYLDMTNQQVGYSIQLHLAQAYKRFVESILHSCKIDNKSISLPLHFEEPIYGSNSPTFTEFMAPGVILSITYFMAVGLTSISFIIERKEGLLDRSWVAGVTSFEVMLAHVIAQFMVMAVQVSLVLIFMILVFEVPAKGPMIWVIVMTILQGICGMAFGLVISALCDNEQDAIQLALGSFYPNMLLSGIIWPLEGMPDFLRYVSYVLPQTFACEAMRGIMSRGWGAEWEPVYRGLLVTLGWTTILLILSAVILRIRS